MLVNKVVKERIAYVKMQNGKHFNCLSEDMCNELMEAITASYGRMCGHRAAGRSQSPCLERGA